MPLYRSTHHPPATRRRTVCLALALSAAILLPGCTVGPDYRPPDIQTPDIWHRQAVQGLAAGTANLQTWWTNLNDPTLTELIDQAGRNNLDLKIAAGRIMEARALHGFARGQYFPDIDGTGIYNRGRAAEDTTPVLPEGTC